MAHQNEIILHVLNFLLHNNFFEFSDVNYQQVSGTSMGAPWVPSYAYLHLRMWEKLEVYRSNAFDDLVEA